MKIEADMYGIIPKAKMEACEKAPPANVSNNPSKPFFEALACAEERRFGFNPGNTM